MRITQNGQIFAQVRSFASELADNDDDTSFRARARAREHCSGGIRKRETSTICVYITEMCIIVRAYANFLARKCDKMAAGSRENYVERQAECGFFSLSLVGEIRSSLANV